MQENFYDWVHITANCFYFDLNVLKFELQYEWTASQIFFCRYRVLQLFCHNVEGTHVIKNWLNVANFSDSNLVLILLETASGSVLKKRCFKKFHNIHRKKPQPESFLFKLQLYQKRDPGTRFFCEFTRFLRTTFNRASLEDCFYFTTVSKKHTIS